MKKLLIIKILEKIMPTGKQFNKKYYNPKK
jgi:hypothetical protein